jgi:SAM-dependent methyltransferase
MRPEFSSSDYWKRRYAGGGNSGPGSYAHLAIFKSQILNAFVAEHDCSTVVEFGCGDGNQLRYAKYPAYTGYDVSSEAIAICRNLFVDDPSKQFHLLDDYDGGTADLALSLDVIFHLVESDVFEEYMQRLFDASHRFVCIYSSNTDDQLGEKAPHVKHRRFSEWITRKRPDWRLFRNVKNPYSYSGDHRLTSFSDFYFFSRCTPDSSQ